LADSPRTARIERVAVSADLVNERPMLSLAETAAFSEALAALEVKADPRSLS
jgi:hypothetical protein